MSVYCIIVTYNGARWIEKCIESLGGLGRPIEVIIVDNGSTDGTIDKVEKKFPKVEIVQPGRNLGFGLGNTIGIKKALDYGADYIFLLNQDAYVVNGTLTEVFDAFNQDPKIGIISPIHLAGDGRNLDFGFYQYAHPNDTPYLLGDFFVSGDLQLIYETKFINAAAWLMRASMVREIGFFHPIFEHYGEDREYVSRLMNRGYKICVFPSFKIIHDRPQNRLGNDYYRYGQHFQRTMMQALVEEKLTFFQVTLKFIRLFFHNAVTFRLRNALSVVHLWIKLFKRKRLLKRPVY